MKKLTKFLTSASIGISLSSVIFLIKDYVYDSAMKEHENIYDFDSLICTSFCSWYFAFCFTAEKI